MSYIPKQTKLTKERLEAKLETGLLQTLQRYCEYLDSDRDYIVSQALEIAFRKDKGFSDWLDSREESQLMPAAAPEQMPVDEVVPVPGRKAGRGRATGNRMNNTEAASGSETGNTTL